MEFKDILKDLREDYSLTQKEVALSCNLSPQCISQLEMGIRNPTGITLVALADFFEVSIDYLMGRIENADNGTIFQQKTLHPLSYEEEQLIKLLRKNPPHQAMDWINLYCKLPDYMQQSIFAELRGMHLGYTTSKNRKTKED